MAEYGVQTNNIFDLLSEDQSQAAKPQQSKRPNATAAPKQQQQQRKKPAAKPAGQPSKSTEGKKDTPTGQPKRVVRRKEGEDQEQPRRNQRRANGPATSDNVLTGGGNNKIRGNAGRVGKYEEKQFTQKEREGKTRGRLYERRPGTGRSLNENKKGGAGKANWGKDFDENLVKEGVSGEELLTPEKQEGAEATAVVPSEDAEKDEDENLVTYEEWKKQQKASKVKLPNKLRTAGEGVDADPKWSEATQYKKQVGEDLRPIKSATKEKKDKGKRKEKEADKADKADKTAPQSLMNDLFNFAPKDRRNAGGNRGDRGNGRSGPNGPRGNRDGGRRREGRGPRDQRDNRAPKKFSPQSAAPQFNDENSFPALSGKAQ